MGIEKKKPTTPKRSIESMVGRVRSNPLSEFAFEGKHVLWILTELSKDTFAIYIAYHG